MQMGILKNYEYEEFEDDGETLEKVEGNVIKSLPLAEMPAVLVTGKTEVDSFDTDFSDDSFDSGTDDFTTFEATPEPVASPQAVAPPVSTVDESQIREELRAELEGHFNDLTTAISNLKVARDEVVQSSQSQLVDLAIMIAEKVIHKQIESDASIIQSVVEDTFNKISGSDRITFKINPADADTFNKFQPTLESRLIGVEKITVQQDGTVDQGGCIIETDLGFVDVTIREKMNLITQTLKKINPSS